MAENNNPGSRNSHRINGMEKNFTTLVFGLISAGIIALIVFMFTSYKDISVISNRLDQIQVSVASINETLRDDRTTATQKTGANESRILQLESRLTVLETQLKYSQNKPK